LAGSRRRTVIVEGPLAFQMRRRAAARAGECGVQILTLPQLAARLAGGFFHPVAAELLEPAVQNALNEKGFTELEGVRQLPGMTRAVARALRRVWDADIDLAAFVQGGGSPRWSDLALIEKRVRGQLAAGAMLHRDLRAAALEQVHRAPALLGPVVIEGLSWVAPLWRPLANSLCAYIPVEWHVPASADTTWFAGTVTRTPAEAMPAAAQAISCADPHHVAVEALRWIRELLCAERAHPSEIAVTAASTQTWDAHFLALAKNTGLRMHFSHGIPVLSTREGQRCAALADVLLRGLSEARVRRLVLLCTAEGTVLDRLPSGWLSALPRGATLLALGDWHRACERMIWQGEPFQGGAVLVPFLTVLAKGPGAAVEAGTLALKGRSRNIWETALRSAPSHAIELTLQNIRLPDEVEPGASVVWCPAGHLSAATRPWVRLLGLTAGAWPRCMTEDPILPQHIISTKAFGIDPVPEADRRAFAVIVASAHAGIVFSRSRRTSLGYRVGPSPLLPQERSEQALSRARIPLHAFSEPDRLMARPVEAAGVSHIASASRSWVNWHRTTLTDHDGRFQADHPVIARALGRIQSPTSLQLLLRGPLGFVWKYGLGWHAPQEQEQPLTIPPQELGKLVHELLRRAVDALEAEFGFASVSEAEMEAALRSAAELVRDTWPLEKPVPPRLLWINTVDHGLQMAVAALKVGETTQVDTRSWTELPFGDVNRSYGDRELPWDGTIPICIPGTEVRIQGAIDRLDLRSASGAVRVTDYKTGQPPRHPERIVICGGAELQRSLYALACRQLLPECRRIVARLVYLSDPPLTLELKNLDEALAQISEFVGVACSLLTGGVAPPGRDTESPFNDLRLAMPASPGYLRRKGANFAQQADRLSSFWDAR
jgi:PD-(D/E)XK nuclease superfamily